MFKDRKIEEFIDNLSSSEPTPGGGTVAASLQINIILLVTWVYNITINKNIFNYLDKSIKSQILLAKDRIDNMTNIFLKLMDDDSRAFTKVMESFKLPKSTEEEMFSRRY